jgi:hypothetical protein
MALPKRMKGFREKARERQQSVQDDYEKSYKTKDDRGFSTVGSYFDLDLLKEMGIEIWRPDVGEHLIDVVQFYTGRQHNDKPQGELAYKVDFWGHQRVGAMNDFFICKAMTWRKPCPICSWMKQNFIKDEKQYKALTPKRRCAYFVWVHDNDEQKAKGLQIFEVSHFFFEKEVAAIAKKPRGGGYVDWTSVDDGRHVFWSINKSGSFEDATGTKRDSIEYTGYQLLERDNPAIPDHILEQSFALDEVIKMWPTDEEIETAFLGSPIIKEAQPNTGASTASRLPKQTALERARDKAKEREPEPEQDEPPVQEEDQQAEPEQDEPEREEKKPEPPKRESPKRTLLKRREEPKKETSDEKYVCPATDVGGVFGETIEQLDDCDDCAIWEQCSDANDANKKAGEGESGKKLVRR